MTGPLFPIYGYGTQGCEKYGWINVLYLNIYQDLIKPNKPQVSSILRQIISIAKCFCLNETFAIHYIIPTSFSVPWTDMVFVM